MTKLECKINESGTYCMYCCYLIKLHGMSNSQVLSFPYSFAFLLVICLLCLKECSKPGHLGRCKDKNGPQYLSECVSKWQLRWQQTIPLQVSQQLQEELAVLPQQWFIRGREEKAERKKIRYGKSWHRKRNARCWKDVISSVGLDFLRLFVIGGRFLSQLSIKETLQRPWGKAGSKILKKDIWRLNPDLVLSLTLSRIRRTMI